MKKGLMNSFEEYLYEAEFVKKINPRTLKGYSNVFNLFLKFSPAITPEALTPATITAFFKTLQERKRLTSNGVRVGIKKSTVATYWGKLNPFFQWLELKRIISCNPFSELPYPTPSYEEMKFLRKEEVEKVFNAIHVHHNNNILILKRNLIIFYLLLFCGLRRGELMQLQLRDIDFERKSLKVRSEISKAGRSRELPLHSTLLMHLKDYYAIRKHYTTPFLIVSSEHDAKLSEPGLLHVVAKLNRCSGVTFHLHQFRHTFAVNFLNRSNNIAKLQQLLGHKSISMTICYLRCLPTSHMRKDIENLTLDGLI